MDVQPGLNILKNFLKRSLVEVFIYYKLAFGYQSIAFNGYINLGRMYFHISLLASFLIYILPVEGYRLIAESL